MSELDARLKRALEIAYERKWEALDKEVEQGPKYEFPKEYDEKVLNESFKVLNTGIGIRRYSWNKTQFYGRPRVRRALLVAALIALMIIGSVAVYAISHPEIIYNIKKTFTEWSFSFQQNDPEKATIDFVFIEPEIPDGFNIVSEEKITNWYEVQYENGQGEIIFYTQNLTDNLGLKINGEGQEYKDIEINGNKGLAYIQNNSWTIIWDNGYYIFELMGNVDYDMLFNMAESIE